VAYSVRELVVAAQPTAVVAESTTWEEFPSLWPRLLAEVWAVVRASDGISPNRNVMLYGDDLPNVEVGVEVGEPFGAVGRVVSSALPAGRVATTLHRGRYVDLGSAHEAVIEWCDGRRLVRAGPRWEIYGHHIEGSEEQEVEISWLLG
jgi:effector-binding domain-containing protein